MYWATVVGFFLTCAFAENETEQHKRDTVQRANRNKSGILHDALCKARGKTVVLIPQENLDIADEAILYYPESYNLATGVLIDTAGLILTSYDIGIGLGAEVLVAMEDDNNYIAQRVRTDAATGLAWFKIQDTATDMFDKCAMRASDCTLGMQLCCVYVDDNGCKKAASVQCAGHTYVQLLSGGSAKGLLLHNADCKISSGSVVLDAQGRLVAIYADTVTDDGARICVPIAIESFKASTREKYRYLNARFTETQRAGVRGLEVVASGCEELHVGDIVHTVNGQKVCNVAHLQYLLQQDGEAKLQVTRDGKETCVTLANIQERHLERYFSAQQATYEMLSLSTLPPQVVAIVKDQMAEVAGVRYVAPGSPFVGTLETSDLILSVNNVPLGSRDDVLQGLDTAASLIAAGQQIVICIARREHGDYVVKYVTMRR